MVALAGTRRGEKAFGAQRDSDRAAWRKHDAVALIKPGAGICAKLGQGDVYPFAAEHFHLMRLFQPGLDHSRHLLSTLTADHLAPRASRPR